MRSVSFTILSTSALALAGCATTGSVRPGMPALAADVAQNRLAQDEGVLEALRKTAAEGAILFAPGPTDAAQWLTEQEPFPPTSWQAQRVLVSCDGTIGVVTGAISWGDHPGYYTTVWRYEPDTIAGGAKWRWVLSHGDGAETPRSLADAPMIEAASCDASPELAMDQPRTGHSADATLRYRWTFDPSKGRTFTVELWDGRAYQSMLEDIVASGQDQ